MPSLKVHRKNHLEYPDKVDQLVATEKFDELLKYTNFSLYKLISDSLLAQILLHNNKTIIKHVVNNINYINIPSNNKISLIHYLVRFLEDTTLLDYFIKKHNLNLELKTNKKWSPIHIACRYRSLDIIKLLVNKGVNLESSNNNKTKPLHLVCRYGTLEMIKLLIKRQVDLNSPTNEGWAPIHIVCHYGMCNTIIYMLNKNVDLDIRIKRYNGKHSDYGIKDLLMINPNLTNENKLKILEIIFQKEKIEIVTY